MMETHTSAMGLMPLLKDTNIMTIFVLFENVHKEIKNTLIMSYYSTVKHDRNPL